MSKTTSNILKGICGFLIVCTHVFGFYASQESLFSITIGSYNLEKIIANCCDIAILIFAFISGYGLFLSYQGKSCKDKFKSTITKISKFLLSYWAVLFIVISPFYWAYTKSFNGFEVLKTMFGHHGYFSYGWYIYFYLLVLITLPFISKLLTKNIWLNLLFSFALFTGSYLLLNLFGKSLKYYDISCVMLFAYEAVLFGASFAKSDFFSKPLFKKHSLLLIILLFVFGLIIEVVGFGILGKGLFQPIALLFLIYPLVCLINNINNSKVTKTLEFMGDNSGNIWYIHSIFLASYTIGLLKIMSIFGFCKLAIVSSVVVYLLSILISIPFHFLNKHIISKIKF